MLHHGTVEERRIFFFSVGALWDPASVDMRVSEEVHSHAEEVAVRKEGPSDDQKRRSQEEMKTGVQGPDMGVNVTPEAGGPHSKLQGEEKPQKE